MHKSDGYDKGHICASEDRVYSTSANKQTFYYSNISPQIGSFNQKYWAALEKQVQTWGRSTGNGVYDKLYVVKGGTTDRLLTIIERLFISARTVNTVFAGTDVSFVIAVTLVHGFGHLHAVIYIRIVLFPLVCTFNIVLRSNGIKFECHPSRMLLRSNIL